MKDTTRLIIEDTDTLVNVRTARNLQASIVSVNAKVKDPPVEKERIVIGFFLCNPGSSLLYRYDRYVCVRVNRYLYFVFPFSQDYRAALR